MRRRRQIWDMTNITRTCNSNNGRKDFIGFLFAAALPHNPSDTIWGGAARHTVYLCVASSTGVIERNMVSFGFEFILIDD